jgi:hypothetical protein
VHAPLYLVEPLKETEMEAEGIRLGIGGEAQRINAALAVAVAHTYLHHTQQGTQVRGQRRKLDWAWSFTGKCCHSLYNQDVHVDKEWVLSWS